MRRRERRQQARDRGPLYRLEMGWTRRTGVDDRLTQTERRLLRRNGLPVEHPRVRMRRRFDRAIADGTIPVVSRRAVAPPSDTTATSGAACRDLTLSNPHATIDPNTPPLPGNNPRA